MDIVGKRKFEVPVGIKYVHYLFVYQFKEKAPNKIRAKANTRM